MEDEYYYEQLLQLLFRSYLQSLLLRKPLHSHDRIFNFSNLCYRVLYSRLFVFESLSCTRNDDQLRDIYRTQYYLALIGISILPIEMGHTLIHNYHTLAHYTPLFIRMEQVRLLQMQVLLIT